MVGVHRIELRVPKLLVYSQLSVHRSLLPFVSFQDFVSELN
jgi:hypothetical protein